MKPILFNTEMVQAILKGNKTVTRRKIDKSISDYMEIDVDGTPISISDEYGDFHDPTEYCRYRKGDILWVRETWQLLPSGFDKLPPEWNYIYKATDELNEECTKWRPSIHMPKKAARIVLNVTDVRVEKLQSMDTENCLREGIDLKEVEKYKAITPDDIEDEISFYHLVFRDLWDGTVKDDRYMYHNNPWVWVIEFKVMWM